MAMVASILAARILESSSFGELSMIRSTVLMFGALAGSGFGVAGTKYIAELRDKDPQRAGRIIGLLMEVAALTGLLTTFGIIAFATPLASIMINAPQLANALQIGSVLLLINTLNGIQTGCLAGLEAYQILARVTTIDAVLNLIFTPIGAWIYGVEGVMAGLVTAGAISLTVRHIALSKETRKKHILVSFRCSRQEFFQVGHTLMPLFVLSMGFYPFEWLAKLQLSRQPDGFAQLGIFTAAYSFGSVILFLPTQALASSQAVLCNLLSNRNSVAFRRVALFSVLVSGGLALIIALPMSILSKLLMTAYGTSFSAAAGVLVIMAFANVFWAVVMPFYKILIAVNKVWVQAIYNVLLGPILCLLAFMLVGKGAVGLAGAYIITWCLMCVLQFGYAWKIVQSKSV